RQRRSPGMKTGFCMFLWTTSVSKKHEPLLKDIKATGYDGVEIPVFSGTPDDYAKLGETLDRIGLERTAVSAMGDPRMNLISPDAATRKAGVDYMKWAIDCSAALGAKFLSGPLHSTLGLFSGAGPTSAEKKRSVASQRAIGAFTKHAKNIVHVHISENDRGVPGRGNIPWDETFAAIRKSGYDGWLTIESFGRGLKDLAAATKVWRDLAESPQAVYRDGYR